MKTTTAVPMDLLPKEIDRFLAGVALDEKFRDDRPILARLFGSPRFAWRTGWLTSGGGRYAFAHLSGWPPGLLTEARARLGSAFVVARAETGLLDQRRHHPFMILLISGRRDAGA